MKNIIKFGGNARPVTKTYYPLRMRFVKEEHSEVSRKTITYHKN